VRAFVTAVIIAFLCVPVAPATGEELPFHEPVVAPGNNALLADMLGRNATLPDDCKFAGGGADGPIIRGNYTCPSGDVIFALVYPDNAASPNARTERFAITVESGAPPPEMIDVVASFVRAREAEFEWLWLTPETDEAGDDAAGGE
jgi:hypothetical protein